MKPITVISGDSTQDIQDIAEFIKRVGYISDRFGFAYREVHVSMLIMEKWLAVLDANNQRVQLRIVRADDGISVQALWHTEESFDVDLYYGPYPPGVTDADTLDQWAKGLFTSWTLGMEGEDE